MDLEDRDKKVLQAVIDSYIATGSPVGSALLVKKYDFHFSPATIRNIMADLEELGFLTHPHTSAGRIPTDKGYRYYIDSLISFERDAAEAGSAYQETLHMQAENIQSLMEEASQFLSTLSHYTGVVVAPSEPAGRYRHVEFIRLRGRQVLIIFVTTSGTVQNKLIDLDERISQEELNAFSSYLEQELAHRSLPEVRERLLQQMREEKQLFAGLLDETYRASREIHERDSEKVYIGGRSRIFESPEFADVDKMRALFKAFEDKYKLLSLLEKSSAAEGIKVFIGSENPFFEMQGCSLVVSGYKAGHVVGTLGVIGPVRMQYKEVIRVVDYTSKLLSRILGERFDRGIGNDEEKG